MIFVFISSASEYTRVVSRYDWRIWVPDWATHSWWEIIAERYILAIQMVMEVLEVATKYHCHGSIPTSSAIPIFNDSYPVIEWQPEWLSYKFCMTRWRTLLYWGPDSERDDGIDLYGNQKHVWVWGQSLETMEELAYHDSYQRNWMETELSNFCSTRGRTFLTWMNKEYNRILSRILMWYDKRYAPHTEGKGKSRNWLNEVFELFDVAYEHVPLHLCASDGINHLIFIADNVCGVLRCRSSRDNVCVQQRLNTKRC